MDPISFPGLGIQNIVINRVAIPFGDGGIYWYGILIALGLVLGTLYGMAQIKRLGESPDQILDLVIWALPFSIIGARLYYVIFEWGYYKNHLNEIYRVWEGGIAIYGAVIASIIVAIVFTKKRKLEMWKYFDVAILGVMIGQIIGRWGNFVNQEAYGTYTALPWGMVLTKEPYPVHPTFLYESLWNLVGFLALHFLSKKKPFHGSIFCGYLIWYGIGRFWVEGLRTDSLWLLPPYIRISQLVSAVAVIVGILLYILLKRKNRKREIL